MRGGGCSSSRRPRQAPLAACRGFRPECRPRAPRRPRVSAESVFSWFGIGTAMTRRASPAKLRRKPAQSLVDEHADDQHQRTRHALLEIAERRRDRAAAVGVVAAVEPELAVRRAPAPSSVPCESSCSRAGHSALTMPASKARGRQLPVPARASAAIAVPGIVELMAAVELAAPADRAGRRRPDRPAGRARSCTFQCSPATRSGARTACACRSITRERRIRLRRDHRRHAALEDAGLLGGDLLERVAEKFEMIDRHRRDHAGERLLDHVGGVEPAAEADFEQQHVGRMAREQQKRRRGLDLEHRDRLAGIDALASRSARRPAPRPTPARRRPARRAGSAR